METVKSILLVMKNVLELKSIASSALKEVYPILYLSPIIPIAHFIKKHNRIRP